MRGVLGKRPLWAWLAGLGVVLAVAGLALALIGGGRPAAIHLTPAPGPSPTQVPSPSLVPEVTPSAVPSASPTELPTPTPVPSRSVPASLRGVEWYTLPTTQKIVALTFDAGSGDQGLAKILKTLADDRIPATFFLTGKFIDQYPGDVRAISAVPMHTIGNHTYDHPHMNQLSDAGVRDEINRAEELILNASGREPWPLFRFPYGESSSRTIADANALGYGSIRWSVDTLGWQGTSPVGGASGGQTVQSVTTRALNAARPGEIVLMHVGAAPDGTTLDADALPAIIDGLRARGYSFVAIWDFIAGL